LTKEAQKKQFRRGLRFSPVLSRLNTPEDRLFRSFSGLAFLECSLCSVLAANGDPCDDFGFDLEFLGGEC
jgi:hypothetical protein